MLHWSEIFTQPSHGNIKRPGCQDMKNGGHSATLGPSFWLCSTLKTFAMHNIWRSRVFLSANKTLQLWKCIDGRVTSARVNFAHTSLTITRPSSSFRGETFSFFEVVFCLLYFYFYFFFLSLSVPKYVYVVFVILLFKVQLF